MLSDDDAQQKVQWTRRRNPKRPWQEIEIVLEEAEEERENSKEGINAVTNLDQIEVVADDIGKLQRECADFKDLIAYLETGTLPPDDKLARKIVFTAEQYIIEDNVLYYLLAPTRKRLEKVAGLKGQLAVPSVLREQILKAFHDELGHGAELKVYESIRDRFYWPGLWANVKLWVDTCKDCEYARPDAHSRKAYLHSHEVPVAAFERVHMDHLQLVKSDQYSYLLVLCDALTQYVELYPCVGCSAKEACEKLIDYISRLG